MLSATFLFKEKGKLLEERSEKNIRIPRHMARVTEHASLYCFHDSKYISLILIQSPGFRSEAVETIQAFLRFREIHLWLSCTAKLKLIGIEETTYTQQVDQYPGSDFQLVVFCQVKITFSCKRQLIDRGYTIFLLIFIVTWSATARANLSILDPASAIFLAALMTSDVFFRGPLPLWNTIQLCTI